MSEPEPPTPGERRLAQPPSDRYRAPERPPAPGEVPTPVSPARGVANAAFVGVTGAIAVTILGGVLTLSAGLIVAAAILGWAIGYGLKIGAGTTIPVMQRSLIAAAVAVGSVALGQVGLWMYAGTEGGVLPLVDYLLATFGPLVPLEAVAAAATAWIAAR